MATSIRTHGSLITLGFLLCLAVDMAASKRVICYATNWPQYRPSPGKFMMSDVDPSKCTHMVFAFAKVVGNQLQPYEINDPGAHGQYMQLTNMKRRYPTVKTLLAVGGWSHGGKPFSLMASTAANRAEFVRTTVTYLRQYNFDGLDLDWEYPLASDRANLASLIMELRQAFDADQAGGKSRLLIAMATAAGLHKARPAYDMAALNRYLDFVNVMTYDFHGAWEKFTGHLSPMVAPPGDEFSIEVAMNWYVQSGISKDKLQVGLALYGRTWTLARAGDYSVGATAIGPGPNGTYTREAGVLSHYEVCERIQQNGYTVVYDQTAKTNYAYGGDEWITYDSLQSIKAKLQYILDQGFGGAMIWSFDLDDFSGQWCKQGKYPLLTEIANTLLNAPSSGGSGGGQPVYRPQQGFPQVVQPVNPPQQGFPQVLQPVYPPQQGFPQVVQPVNPPQQGFPQFAQPIYPPQQVFPQVVQPVNPPQQGFPQVLQPVYAQQQGSPQAAQPIYPQTVQPTYYFQPAGYPQIYPNKLVDPASLVNGANPGNCPIVQVPQEPSSGNILGNFRCPSAYGKFALPNSCQAYVFCTANIRILSRCPMFSQFNPVIGGCECAATSTYKCPLPVQVAPATQG